ncbi:MAG: M1 family aminopeptidase [Spirosomataceae bacterium]
MAPTNTTNILKNVLWLCFVLPSSLWAQDLSTGIDACAQEKAQAFGRLRERMVLARTGATAALGDENINVTYYKLNLVLDYDTKNLIGAITIFATSNSGSLTQVALDLQNKLTTDSVKVNNSRVVFVHQNNKLQVNLPTALAKDQALSLTVYYHGTPGSSGFGSFVFGKHNQNRDNVIWSLSEPYGASDWFPCDDDPSDKADSSEVWITAPAYFTSVSNGTLQRVQTNANGTKTYQWKSRYPIAPYLISIALSNYRQYNNYFKYSPTDSMLVSHFVYPEVFDANKANLDRTVFMLDLFSQKFGLYPFIKEKYGHAQCGFSGGMEHQTCTSAGSFSNLLVAHELTHQWFGDKITCKNWQHIWLNEGFASYGEAVYTEAVSGMAAYQTYLNNFMTRAKRAKSSIFVKNVQSENEIFNSDRTYAKGASVLHMLRGVVGDESFFKLLKTYAASSFAYGNATTEDFQGIAETISGHKLDYFFRQWIYGENYPVYQVTWNAVPEAGQYRVTVNIKQTTNTEPVYFTMPIQLGLSMGGTIQQMVRVFNNKPNQSFSFLSNVNPDNLSFDPNNWILKDATVTKTSSIETSPETVWPTDWLCYPNPTSANATMSFTLLQNATISWQLHDLVGHLLAEDNRSLSAGQYAHALPTQELSTGIYLLTFVANDQRRVIRVVKQ